MTPLLSEERLEFLLDKMELSYGDYELREHIEALNEQLHNGNIAYNELAEQIKQLNEKLIVHVGCVQIISQLTAERDISKARLETGTARLRKTGSLFDPGVIETAGLYLTSTQWKELIIEINKFKKERDRLAERCKNLREDLEKAREYAGCCGEICELVCKDALALDDELQGEK